MTVTDEVRSLFVIPVEQLTIVLDDGRFAGGEIDLRREVPQSVLRRLNGHRRDYVDAPEGSDEEWAALDALYALFAAEVLVAWNLADHHGEIPASHEGMHRLTDAVALTIINTWRQAITGGMVMPPLAPSSPPGDEPATSTSDFSSAGTPDPARPTPTPEPLSIP
jgi:hypothetical protein